MQNKLQKTCRSVYCAGQKGRSDFSTRSYGKTQMAFLANPVYTKKALIPPAWYWNSCLWTWQASQRPPGALLCHSRGDTSEHGWQQRLFSMRSFPLGHTVAMPSLHLKNQHLLLINKTALILSSLNPHPSKKNCSKSFNHHVSDFNTSHLEVLIKWSDILIQ